MANEEHFVVLMDALEKKDIQIWNQWREDNPDYYLGFAFISLLDADLAGINLAHANLSLADLRGANLTNANLSRALLGQADLMDANLSCANLSRAILSGANLNSADLSGAHLNSADLGGVHLNSVNLTNTKLNRADLYNAGFENARCFETVFANVDLSQVKGLERVVHLGPSSIDFRTLQKSGGNIPEIFMRGCGFSDNFIMYVRSMITSAIDFYSCFISYSHADKVFARRVHDTLQERGIRCWLGEEQMLPGGDIYEEIDPSIRYRGKVLLCCSEHSLTSWWVDNEINIILKKRIYKSYQQKELALIPIDLDGYLFSDEFISDKKLDLHSRVAADFTGWETSNTAFEEQIELVIKALQTGGGKEDPPEPKLGKFD